MPAVKDFCSADSAGFWLERFYQDGDGSLRLSLVEQWALRS